MSKAALQREYDELIDRIRFGDVNEHDLPDALEKAATIAGEIKELEASE